MSAGQGECPSVRDCSTCKYGVMSVFAKDFFCRDEKWRSMFEAKSTGCKSHRFPPARGDVDYWEPKDPGGCPILSTDEKLPLVTIESVLSDISDQVGLSSRYVSKRVGRIMENFKNLILPVGAALLLADKLGVKVNIPIPTMTDGIESRYRKLFQVSEPARRLLASMKGLKKPVSVYSFSTIEKNLTNLDGKFYRISFERLHDDEKDKIVDDGKTVCLKGVDEMFSDDYDVYDGVLYPKSLSSTREGLKSNASREVFDWLAGCESWKSGVGFFPEGSIPFTLSDVNVDVGKNRFMKGSVVKVTQRLCRFTRQKCNAFEKIGNLEMIVLGKGSETWYYVRFDESLPYPCEIGCAFSENHLVDISDEYDSVITNEWSETERSGVDVSIDREEFEDL